MPKVLLKTHQSTLETVASLVKLELRPFKPGGGGIGVVPRYPDDLDREEKRAIHRSDVLFWLDQPEKTGWLLNGLPVNAIDSGMVKFAGLAIETNQLHEDGRTQEATRQVTRLANKARTRSANCVFPGYHQGPCQCHQLYAPTHPRTDTSGHGHARR